MNKGIKVIISKSNKDIFLAKYTKYGPAVIYEKENSCLIEYRDFPECDETKSWLVTTII